MSIDQLERVSERMEKLADAMAVLSEKLAVSIEKISKFEEEIKDHKDRIASLETFRNKGLGVMAVIGFIGGLIAFFIKLVFSAMSKS